MSLTTAGFALSLVCCAQAAAESSADEIDLETVRAAWSRRAEQIRTAEFVWTVRTTRPESYGTPERRERAEAYFDGDGFEFRTVGESPDGREAVQRTAFDGERSKALASADGAISSGETHSKPYAYGTMSLALRPVLLAVRPVGFGPGSADLSAARLLPGRRELDDLSCVVLEDSSNEPFTLRYWLDPARDFSVVRYESLVKGRPSVRQDVTFTRETDSGLYLPAEWKSVFVTEEGELSITTRNAVTKVAVNAPLPEGVIAFEFPPGTSLLDEASGRESTVLGGADPRATVAAPARPGGGGDRGPGWLWWGCGGLAAVLVLIIFYVRR